MNATIQRDVVRRLVRDFEFKEKDKYLQQGICPACHKRELFTSIEKPWILKCGRENNCGHQVVVKELYSDIFEDWSKRYQDTPEIGEESRTRLWITASTYDFGGISVQVDL